VYAIGDQHHLGSNTADMFIAREIPVRDNVIMANRKMAGAEPPQIYDHMYEIDDTGLPYWLKDEHERRHAGALRDLGSHERLADFLSHHAYTKLTDANLSGNEEEADKWYPRSCQAEDYLKAVQQYVDTQPKEANRKMAGDNTSWEETMRYIDDALANGEPGEDDYDDGTDDREMDYDADDGINNQCPYCGEVVTDPKGLWHHDCPIKYTPRKQAQKSHAELVAMIDKLADWTKYDSPDPINDMGKSKPPSTNVTKPPKDWATRLPKGDPSKKGGTWTPPTIPRKKK
jgi:hypothetical protein